ncbi:cellulase family glycosylhydrolase [Thiolinea disciformis]|uniref:cellulase family glycosylhydrolase n=1 Tax=Thiolinea disciformis TaxID=125614 RepID=UPI0012FF3E05|nr:cellulase family glycosylhydrolase [Thiolinea disciformis]
MSILIWLLGLTSLCFSATLYAQPLTPKLFGVQLRNDDRPLPENWPSMVQQTGSNLVRIPVPWAWFELNSKGNSPSWFWPNLDSMVSKAKSANQKVLISVFSTPCWATVNYSGKNCTATTLATGAWKYNMPPAKASDFADALTRLATHYNTSTYKSTVIAYEVWNEPNTITFWANAKRRTLPFEYNDGYPFHVDRASIKAYTQLVVAGYKAVKAVNPNLKLLAGSIAGNDLYFLDEMYKAGAQGYFDALSLHPYPSIIQAARHPFYGRAANMNDCFSVGAITYDGCLKQGVEAFRQKMLSYNDNKPIWFTEFGVSSTPDWGGVGVSKTLGASEQAQASEAFKMIHLIKSWDFVEAAIWYELINRPKQADYSTNLWAQPEAFFGLYREDSSVKPVRATYQSEVKAKPVPVQLYPAGEVNKQSYTREFSWQSVPNATGYVLWLNYQTNPVQNGKINRYVTAAQANCATGYTCRLADTTAFASNVPSQWWIKAFFADGTTRDSSVASFKLIEPAYPTLISPKQNVVVTTIAEANAPTFIWQPYPNAQSYRIWIRGYKPFGVERADLNGEEQVISNTLTPSQAACTTTTCRYKPPSVNLGYSPSKWGVTAVLSNGQERISPTQAFTLYPSKTLLTKPAQIEPEGMVTTQRPTYAWLPVATATAYRLWVNSAAGAGVINITIPSSVCSISECRYTPTRAVGKGDATWWVTAIGTQEAVSEGMVFRAP